MGFKVQSWRETNLALVENTVNTQKCILTTKFLTGAGERDVPGNHVRVQNSGSGSVCWNELGVL